MIHDVVIIGGGPGGLAAALTLGRGRKRVVLCDAGPRRNQAATHVHNFVTRDGTPPEEFRRIGRAQLEPYGNVIVRDAAAEAITGERGAFTVRVGGDDVRARRVLLCTGMIDEVPAIEGAAALWGTAIFQCPYCHGWEVRDRRFGTVATQVEMLDFALLLRGWSADVVAFTNGTFAVPPETAARLEAGGVVLDERPLVRVSSDGARLAGVELLGGGTRALDVLFMRPPQRQVPLVRDLGLALDPAGFVQVDPMRRETSRPGIYAGGDLVTPMQAAIVAAASAMHAAASLNHELTIELAVAGTL